MRGLIMSTLKDLIGHAEIKIDFGVRLLSGKSLKTGKTININHPVKIEIDQEDVTITTVKNHRYKLIDCAGNVSVISELHRALNYGGWLPTN